MKTFTIYNLGCSKNIIDGEQIAAFFKSCGFRTVNNFDKAEIIIVNTCTFIQEATEETVEAILDMAQYKQNGICKLLVVSGCFSQRHRNKVQNDFPEVDLWLDINNWHKEINTYFKTNGIFSWRRILSSQGTTQYIKISDGCSHKCSFCIIPSIRGKFKSRSVDSILQEAEWLYSNGTRECIIVSQDTSYYGRDRSSSLQKLLEIILNKTKFHWIRMMYLHPALIDDSLLNLVASEKRICSYLDIPIQHIAKPVLTAMNRTPSIPSKYYELIDRIRTIAPETAIRTSIVLGFPGENKDHFNQLLKFIEWARFEKLGVFPFSPEEGTKAFNMRPRPWTSTVMKRCETLMDLQREISREICESKIDSEMEIIIDRISDDPEYTFEGRTEKDAPEIDGRVFISNSDHFPGAFIKGKIIDTNEYDLFAIEKKL